MTVGAMVGLSNFAQAASPSYNNGDLLACFRVTTSGTTGYGTDFLVDLGSPVTFRNLYSGGQSLNIKTVGTDLTTTFGAGWNTRTDLYWSIVGATSQDGQVSGDRYNTIYASIARIDNSNIGSANNSGVNKILSTSRDALSGNINDTLLAQTFAGSTVGANLAVGKADATIADKSYTSLATASPQFSVSSGGGLSWDTAEQQFTGGNVGTYGSAGTVYGALDLYRAVGATGGSAPDSAVGVPSFLTTVVVDSSGNISAVPEPSTYALLAMSGVVVFFALRRRVAKA